MVLSNKKLKQKLREAKTELLLASESQKNSSSRTSKPNLENPSSISQESVKSLLKTATQIPRLSKREKRREKAGSLPEKAESLGEGEVDDVDMDVDVESKKRKRSNVDNEEVNQVKIDSVSKKKKKKKKKKRKTTKKVENGDLEKKDVDMGLAGDVVQAVVETMTSYIYDSQENLDPCTKIYAGGIPFYSTEDDIRSYFESCGTITEIDCMKFPESGKFRGIAIITFKTEAAAERALALDGSDMGGLFLKIQPYKSERANKVSPFTPAIVEGYNRIYVGNLSWEITEDDLRSLFSNCNITSIRFGEDKETGVFKGYGHVDFSDSESVKTALKLDQNVVLGRPIRISCAVAKKTTVAGSTPFQQKPLSNQLKSEDSKPFEQNTTANQSNSNNTNEVLASSTIRRRTCYECGDKGHISSDCPKQQANEQANPEDGKTFEQNTNTYQRYSNYTDIEAPAPVSSKIKRRTCYECGEKGHLSSDCPKQQTNNQANPEDSKSFEQNTNTYQRYSNYTDEEAPVPVSSKIKRRTCYECGEKGHLSSDCPKKQATDQANTEYSKPVEQNTYIIQPKSNDTIEVAPVPVSSKIKRRTCYECGEKGHLSSDCPKKQETDQANSKPLEQNQNIIQSHSNGTIEVAPVPVSSKIKRRTCYECGEKGHLSSDCPKKQGTDQANPMSG